MRIIFIGTVQFSLKALEKLIYLKANIVGVCTKKVSSFNADFIDLTPICKKNNIPFIYVDDINSKESINWINGLKPDIIFCFGWSSLIKKELLSIPPMGIVGFHPAKLPENRGRHPLIWALVLGLKESASTFFFMNEGADDGDILSQQNFEILYEDNAETLYIKVIKIALLQIELFLPLLQKKDYRRVKQNHSISNIWRKRFKRDGELDFRMSSRAIYDLVRGLSKPYVGAHISYKGTDIKIWEVKEIKNGQMNIEPGKIIDIKNNSIIVKCYTNAIKIINHEFKDLPKVGEYL